MIRPKSLIAILASVLALASVQAAQVKPAPTGTATGVVLSANGKPAAGVRVYAVPAGDPNNVVTASSAVFESLAQTDPSGRFRLEVPAGRYYIAAGSVATPTYYPDVASIAAAKVITIAAGTTTDGVNFSKYVPASPSTGPFGFSVLNLPPGSTGVLSGVVQNADGTPASGVTVVAVPVSTLSGSAGTVTTFSATTNNLIQALNLGTLVVGPAGNAATASVLTMLRLSGGGSRAVTDNTGRYRIDSVSPDTYNIVAGYSDSPVFYPGTSDIKSAKSITTTPTTLLDTLNFTMPPPPKKTSIRGHVTAIAGRPAQGATLALTSINLTTTALAYLPNRTYGRKTSDSDGAFEFTDVVPGLYTVQAMLSGTSPISRNVIVADQPLNMDFMFRIAVLSGTILTEDGKPFSDPALRQLAVTTTSNPNVVATSLLSVGRDGSFSGVLESNTYRLFAPDLPSEYEIQSIKFGAADLLKDPLTVTGDVPIDVEIRIARRPDTQAKVSGKLVDAVTGAPVAADRLRLCCLASGPVERISTRVLPDGSFEFAGVPAGVYSVELQGTTAPGILNSKIETGAQGKTGLTLVSARDLVPVMVGIAVEGGGSLTPESVVSLTMTSTTGIVPPISGNVNSRGGIRIITVGLADETLFASLPAGVRYNVAVSNLPPGYRLKSITSGAIDLLAEPLGVGAPGTQRPAPIRITLTRVP